MSKVILFISYCFLLIAKWDHKYNGGSIDMVSTSSIKNYRLVPREPPLEPELLPELLPELDREGVELPELEGVEYELLPELEGVE